MRPAAHDVQYATLARRKNRDPVDVVLHLQTRCDHSKQGVHGPDGRFHPGLDRYKHRSTIITSQLSVEHWHETMANPTLADAILDRLIHRAYRLKLEGESMRKQRAQLHESAQLSSL